MKINGTLTTKSGSWNQAKKHVDRNWKHDKNEKSVDKSLSKYNLHDKNEGIKWTDDRFKNKLLKLHYSKFIQKRNAHFRKQGHPNRQQSIDEYLKGKTTTELGIATAGTMDNKIDMKLKINQAYSKRSRAENNKRYYQASSWALKRYVHGFNKRNPYCPIYHWWTNIDETGAPHVHFAMVPLGYTKLDKNGQPRKATMKPYKSGKRKGQMHRVTGSKPTGDLTRAIEMQFGTNNRRKAFKDWNDQETKAIVRVFGSTFHQRFGKVKDWNKPFELQHTGRKGSLSMKSYKATWDKFDQIKREQDQRKNKQNQREQSQNAREIELSEKESQFAPKQRELSDMNIKLPQLRATHQDLILSNHNLRTRNKDLTKSNNNLEAKVQKERDNVHYLSHQQNRLQQSIRELKRTKNNIKSYLAKKWESFKKRHLNGFYHGLAVGIHHFYPQYNMKSCEEFATGHSSLYWGHDVSTQKSGISLFLKGLTTNGNLYYQKMKSTNNIKKSFSNTIHLDKSPYWRGFKTHYMKHNNNEPNPVGHEYLDLLQKYAISRDEKKYAARHNNSLAGFEFNKSERKVNLDVGANPNAENNYSKPCYAHGVDDPDNTPHK